MIAANLLGGLGLFFLGVKALSSELKAVGGLRLRTAMARGTRRTWHAALLGLLLGATTQSSNAVTFIAASLRSAGAIAPVRVLPLVAWSNVGTAGLVLIATFDLLTAALWLLAVVGCMRYFARDGGGRWRGLVGAGAALGLLLLGLALIKAGAGPLREMEAVRGLLAIAGDARLPVFVVGAVITLVAQSSSTVSILAITLQAAGLLGFDQAVMAVYGASLGSGAAVWLMAGGLAGTARQPVLFQAWLKIAGALLFALLLLVEEACGFPLVLALSDLLAKDTDTRLAMLFLLLQVVPAALVMPINRPLGVLLERLVPPTTAEELARPVHLYPAALEDGPSALELVSAEQARLLRRMPALLDAPRGEAADGQLPPVSDLSGASARLETEIGLFLEALMQRRIGDEAQRAAVHASLRMRLLHDLREAVAEFAESAERAPEHAGSMLEALHLLLTELAEADGAEAKAWLVELAADRGEMMRQIRRRAASVHQEAILLQTALFERAVWLIRRLALFET